MAVAYHWHHHIPVHASGHRVCSTSRVQAVPERVHVVDAHFEVQSGVVRFECGLRRGSVKTAPTGVVLPVLPEDSVGGRLVLLHLYLGLLS